MKIIDSKGKIFGLINVIDLLVVVLILAVGAGAGYKYIQGKNATSQAENTECDFVAQAVVKEILSEFVKYYKVGDKVYDGADFEIGTITAVDVSPAVREIANSDGIITNSEVPLRSKMVLTIEGSSNFEELRGIRLGKEYKYAGATLILKNSYISIGSYITGFEVIDTK